jgi:hypothetical protein
MTFDIKDIDEMVVGDFHFSSYCTIMSTFLYEDN